MPIKRIISRKEFDGAYEKLMQVWDCRNDDTQEKIEQFDVNFEIANSYIHQQPLSDADEKAYQEQLAQSNEQYLSGNLF